MVQIPVTVTDPRGAPVLGLGQSSFRLFEDGVELPITNFSMSDTPISTGIVFDSSRSMKSRIEASKAAVEQFLKTGGAGDDYFLVRFSDKVEALSGITGDTDEISRQLATIKAAGWTALFDAIGFAAHAARNSQHRRVLVVLTDGEDNNSRYSESELISMLREADVGVYAISLIDRPRHLKTICEETGGSVIWVRKMSELPDAMEDLSRRIRSEYLLSYIPAASPNDGRYHKVRIEVQQPEGSPRLSAYWRRGYMAPGE